MLHKKTLIIDCDGVLYPSTQLSLRDFVRAMKQTFELNLKAGSQIQDEISKQTIKEKKLGIFNYIKAMCDKQNYSFALFCRQMVEKIDYGKIERDENLLNLLNQARQKDDVVILTNNHSVHLDKVVQQRFGKSIFELQGMGIDCYDITSTLYHDRFLPKQDSRALKLFAERNEKLPEDCVLLDDSPVNIAAAEKIGMNGVLIDEKNTLSAYLKRNYMSNEYHKSGKENDRF